MLLTGVGLLNRTLHVHQQHDMAAAQTASKLGRSALQVPAGVAKLQQKSMLVNHTLHGLVCC